MHKCISPLHKPLHWRAKRDQKAQLLSLQSFLREGRVVGVCWAQLKSKGPKGRVETHTCSAMEIQETNSGEGDRENQRPSM